VTVRALGPELALPTLVQNLDAAVRRVGAERLHMSCVAAIIDASAREVSFVNAGHVSPYLVRAAGPGQEGELLALVARGQPLGAGHPPSVKVSNKPLCEGDFLVWYTDGLPDAANPAGEKLGDRRLQRMLRGLATERDVEVVSRQLLDVVTAHRGGSAFGDDVTVVVARLGEPVEAQRPRSGEITVATPRRPS
jgi:serine phosphatase RsbU (regulator of sigma subunit)